MKEYQKTERISKTNKKNMNDQKQKMKEYQKTK